MFPWITSLFLVFILFTNSICQDKAFDNPGSNSSTEACSNFFEYANKKWLEQTDIPPDQGRWGSFEIVGLSNRLVIKYILESKAKNTSGNDRILGGFYKSCVDEENIEKLGASPLKPILKNIASIKTPKQLMITVAALHKSGVPVLFSFGSTIDIRNSSMRIAGAAQPDFNLNRDYYVKDDDNSRQIRGEYLKHIAKTLQMLGETDKEAQLNAGIILDIETTLAKVSKTQVELRNPEDNYNLKPTSELAQITPNLFWKDYLTARGAGDIKKINFAQPSFFQKIDDLITKVPLNHWKQYLRWQFIITAAPLLSKKFSEENFKFFGQKISGIKQPFPRWRQCVDWASPTFGEALGQEFVKRNFSPQLRSRVEKITLDIIAAFRERLSKLDWMNEETKQQAIAKLNAVKYRIGYPDIHPEYPDLIIKPGAFAQNMFRMAEFNDRRDLQSIDRPNDKTRWDLNPQINNASYMRDTNQATFPAGILQPPFFNPAADEATNYGSIGAIIGHEITHGFDDQGSKFDAAGNLKSWWTDEDRRNFIERTDCLVEQYGKYEVDNQIFVNGKLTLGENIADLGGLSIAYEALKKLLSKGEISGNIDGLTPEQRFFLGWARVYFSKSRIEALRLQVKGDPHTPRHLRVNGVLSDMPEFAEAYGCKIGDAMVHIPRCRVW